MPGSIIPPPLVRGGQQVSAKLGPQASSQVVMPPLVRGAQVSRCVCVRVGPGVHPSVVCQDWLISVAFLSPVSQQIHNVRQHPSTGPPPLLLAPRASVPSMQIQGQRIIQQGLIRVANVSNTSLLVNIPQVSLELRCKVGVGLVLGLKVSLCLLGGDWCHTLVPGSGGVLDTPEGGTGVLLGMKILHGLAFSKVRKLLRQWGLFGDAGIGETAGSEGKVRRPLEGHQSPLEPVIPPRATAAVPPPASADCPQAERTACHRSSHSPVGYS